MSSFTRGSQLSMHKLRMLAQGTKVALIFSLLLGFAWIAWRIMSFVGLTDLYYWFAERWATFKLDMLSPFLPTYKISITIYDFVVRSWKTMPALAYKQQVWRSECGIRLIQLWHWLVQQAWFELLAAFAVGILAAYAFFAWRGKQQVLSRKTRGNDLVEPKVLKKMLGKAKKLRIFNWQIYL